MLNSIQIRGFRAFRELTVPTLGRVNLIVGRNNIGKTTFLEAIHLVNSGPSALLAAQQLLDRRQEYLLDHSRTDNVVDYMALFHRGVNTASTISVGTVDGESLLKIRPQWRHRVEDEEGNLTLRITDEPPDDESSERILSAIGPTGRSSVALSTRRRSYRGPQDAKSDDSIFLPLAGFQANVIDSAELWDRIVLTEKEDAVLDALRVIEPELERLVMVSGRRNERRPLAKLKHRNPVALKGMGDGMSRLFEVAVGLVNVAQGGAFLVDELDSGLHFRALVDVWKLVFRTATALNVQIFATTHSWDCIEAFQTAAASHPAHGVLIRLAAFGDLITAECFEEDELAIITRDSIEVR